MGAVITSAGTIIIPIYRTFAEMRPHCACQTNSGSSTNNRISYMRACSLALTLRMPSWLEVRRNTQSIPMPTSALSGTRLSMALWPLKGRSIPPISALMILRMISIPVALTPGTRDLSVS